MGGYAKSWTDKFNDSWYMSLKLHERGFWDQLFTYAKLVGDTGSIYVTNLQQISSIFGCDVRTCRKIVAKMQQKGKVILTESPNLLQIEIVNYIYWQRDKKVTRPESNAKMPQKCSTKIILDYKRREEINKGESGKPDNIPYQEIINHLNQETGRSFNHKSEATRKLIRGRWEDGYKQADFAIVHKNMVAAWSNDPKMRGYLRPSTLYRASHFDEYLNRTEEDGGDTNARIRKAFDAQG